jgi:hypothetical protein
MSPRAARAGTGVGTGGAGVYLQMKPSYLFEQNIVWNENRSLGVALLPSLLFLSCSVQLSCGSPVLSDEYHELSQIETLFSSSSSFLTALLALSSHLSCLLEFHPLSLLCSLVLSLLPIFSSLPCFMCCWDTSSCCY